MDLMDHQAVPHITEASMDHQAVRHIKEASMDHQAVLHIKEASMVVIWTLMDRKRL
jgi:hypothetical protein